MFGLNLGKSLQVIRLSYLLKKIYIRCDYWYKKRNNLIFLLDNIHLDRILVKSRKLK